MLKIAIVSDLHANQEAMLTAFDDIERREADEVICLGDLVGYNANPNECCDFIRERNIPCLCGNHDAVASGIEEPVGFNPVALQAALWTREILRKDNILYLRNLPDRWLFNEHLMAVHGSPSHRDTYIFTKKDAEKEFRTAYPDDVQICFFGHTHFPVIYTKNNSLNFSKEQTEYVLKPGEKYLVNPGAIGQPRDSDVRSSYIMFYPEDRGDDSRYYRRDK